MLDIRLIREQPEFVREGLRKLYADPSVVDSVLALDEQRRAVLTETESLQAERNRVSKEVARTRDAEERQRLVARSREIGAEIAAAQQQLA